MKNFNDKVAAITGAGSGMGRALARSLAAQGCHVAISDITEDALNETRDLIANRNVKVTTHVLDVSDRQQVEQYAEDVAREHGRVNLIFNNAGVSVTDTVEHFDYSDFEWLININ
ncbi:MAG: SDR family oxidoreductase, partial [Pseudomonadales bacterium]|nr:SDR family oxidoreductase [Pseudomonadales bacterium]